MRRSRQSRSVAIASLCTAGKRSDVELVPGTDPALTPFTPVVVRDGNLDIGSSFRNVILRSRKGPAVRLEDDPSLWPPNR